MFYGNIRQWERDRAYFHPVFDRAFAFLRDRDPAGFAPGRHDLDGENLFVLVQDVRTEDEAKLRYEAHARYTDVHVVITGREKQLYAADGAGLAVTEDKYADRDVAFFARPEFGNSVILEPLTYAVYPAGELHCPCCAVDRPGESVRKFVFKIARLS
ncbi:MAG: YhcH/YjgK/YiaL family protein [Deltaproteobacteria bacterium]|jgi:biofilm protein TabA|nr:YhcH/YjgK/YiaL family protein [Deltaproteobacteria bacterium]